MHHAENQPPEFETGAPVYATDGLIGILERPVQRDEESGTWMLQVRSSRDGSPIRIPGQSVAVSASTSREIRLAVSSSEALRPMEARGSAPADTLVVPEYEEVLIPQVRDVDFGSVIVRKRVESVPVEATVELLQDEVTVERVPIDRQVDSAPAPRYDGDVLVIPIVEEVLVTQKRLMLREEVRITRRRTAEPTTIRDSVRREVVEVDQRGDVSLDDTAGSEHLTR